jgi:hypothetical protein
MVGLVDHGRPLDGSCTCIESFYNSLQAEGQFCLPFDGHSDITSVTPAILQQALSGKLMGAD